MKTKTPVLPAIVVALALAPLSGTLSGQVEPPRGASAGSSGELVATFGGSFSLAPLLETSGVSFEVGDAFALGGRGGLHVNGWLSPGLYVAYLPASFTAVVDGAKAEGPSLGILAIGVDLLVHPLGRQRRLAPFVVGGAGNKAYLSGDEEDEHDATWNVGAGLDLGVGGRWGVRLEARDHMSVYAPPGRGGTLQHDVALAAGLFLRVAP